MKPISAAVMLPLFLYGAALHAQDATVIPEPGARVLPAAAIPDQYIVELKPGQSPHAVAPAHGVAVKFIYQKVLNGFAGTIPPGRLAALKADPRVARIVPDRAVHAIGKPTGGGGAPPPEVVPEGVKRIGAAPGALAVSGNGVGVAIVDTGVDFLHTDLQVSATSFSAFGGSGQDDQGHGTHVAGIVAANDNTTDVVGVAPKATIYAVKVLDASGRGSDAAVISGLDWVTANAAAVIPPIKVANMSLGRSGSIDDNELMHTAVQKVVQSGVTLVVAAGNNALGEVSQFVPATYPEVIAVASTTAATGTSLYRAFPEGIAADTASYFTTDGEFVNGIGVSISAPGEDAENVSRQGGIQSVGILSLKLGGGTTRMSGTSMAAPHVAGVAALLCEQDSELTPDQIWTRITGSASRFGIAPLNSPTSNYTFDGEREGILSAPGALTVPAPAP